MRYKKGCKVEVRSYKTMLISWQCAEFISGSDHSCLVKFESKKEEAVFERVSWNDIRPCPPSSVEDIDLQFVSGDVLEVFDHGSWLTAVVLKVLNKGCYSVRLLGSSKELKIHKSRIRLRLSWQHEKWLSVGQGSRRNQHFKPNGVRNILKFKLRQIKKDFIPFEDNERYRRKVDDGDFYPKEKPGEKGKHYSSFNDYDDNDDACSVGSCSVVISGNTKNGVINYNEKNIGAKVRSLEKYAYRSTLVALFASGPLSWEQEVMLTNLRSTLHISDDEHLVELRNLLSSEKDTESVA
ncbi:uncharacterized protein LOC124928676 isoform X1 [Impatiens glandulifera]|uniref:uncharacterized protein LOC124928676 isoform X1 n=1 Tax=Impatiens glandulifera TaxID=253017 RepID=UPI001FB12EA2|nr:uncharacterized protein LOC124928676 isoform X1 [Impatiens glandulifera]